MKRVLAAGRIQWNGRRPGDAVDVSPDVPTSEGRPRWGFSGVDGFHPYTALHDGECVCGRDRDVNLHTEQVPNECEFCHQTNAGDLGCPYCPPRQAI